MTDLNFRSNHGLPPTDLECEEAILGGIMLDPEAMGRVIDILKFEAFSDSSHVTIYKGFLDLHSKGLPLVSLGPITGWLTDKGFLKTVGGRNKIASLADSVVSAVNIDFQAKRLMELYERRNIIKAGNDLIELGYQTETELTEIRDRIDQRISTIAEEKKESGLVHISETLITTYQDIETRSNGTASPGIPCGFYDLDAMTSGFQRSDLIIVAARPSLGKTAFALNMAHYIGAAKMPIAFFSLEMSKDQLVQRLLSSETGIESSSLRTGKVFIAQWDSLFRAINSLSESEIYIDDTADITVNHVRSQCRRLQKAKGDLGLVVIDYLQLMGGSGDDDVKEISRITRGLKKLARELNVPIIALSQLNRGVEARTNKRPMLSDLRQSGSIEQDADIVMMLYRDEYYNPDTPDRGIAEIIIAKHRNGPTGTVKLLFDPQYTKFRNLATGGY